MSDVRLRALRMVGFKSFAEKTTVEFGPGISAIVGPNGAGKSNLADALRWTLGEQGRSLRTRRAEDVIFAGSSTRRATGMADVTLVIDNADQLLPVDFAEVELGRRLFRSGENEYLLNRQRIRLRDLVDLLDTANLADNAFLFIGQGMVDQALALRPEERRPLFEEAAGIRRHDRRRRHAEAELAEAETNLERVRDVLAELRPQAKRLAAQAEQQEARHSAGESLASALVAAARSRLLAAIATAEAQRSTLAAAQDAADSAMADLREAEDAAAGISRALADRTEVEHAGRAALETARRKTVEARLAETRIAGDREAIRRDRQRLAGEQTEVARRADEARRAAAAPVPAVDRSTTDALQDGDTSIDAERRRLAELRDRTMAASERTQSAVAARAARKAETERLLGRDREARRESERALSALAATETRAAESEQAHAAATEGLVGAIDGELLAEAAWEAARSTAEAADEAARHARGEWAGIAARLEAARIAEERLDASLAGGDDRLLRAARSRGGQRVAEGLDVDPALRLAVESVLGDAITGVIVDRATATALGGSGTGTLVIRDGSPRIRAAESARAEAAVLAAGGGRLVEAIRRDPGGAITALLSRALWAPDLSTAIRIGAMLPAGWSIATRDGSVVSDDGLVRVGRSASRLERQAELTDAAGSRAALEGQLATSAVALASADDDREAARRRVVAARGVLDDARRERRVADDRERASARLAEAAARERAWAISQSERAATASSMAADALATASPGEDEISPEFETADPAGHDPDPAAAEIVGIEQRIAALLDRQVRLTATVTAAREAYEAADDLRRRAEISLAMDEPRLRHVDEEMARLLGSAADADNALERATAEVTAAGGAEQRLASALESILAAAGGERGELMSAERRASDARERLRAAESRSRTAAVGEMEARLLVDGVREQLLVELASIGDEGLRALDASSGGSEHGKPADSLPLEDALDAAIVAWRAGGTDTASMDDVAAQAPGTGRLASLRRRYHELGATNPFAAEEYAEIRVRLETLEAQREDLGTAIAATRRLIGELGTLINTQFRTTFAALEDAFARRFRQLFDGGEARLSLTDPEDLSATGVEITARPPGKKRQPLAMLSGGERALTAVALLMAMLEVRPVPFCVLDEVDAALDEANIGRFSAALRTLAEKIQFIVITHNRGTIEAADALYGVTVGDDAVSHVISLRLGDVTDQVRPPVAVSVG